MTVSDPASGVSTPASRCGNRRQQTRSAVDGSERVLVVLFFLLLFLVQPSTSIMARALQGATTQARASLGRQTHGVCSSKKGMKKLESSESEVIHSLLCEMFCLFSFPLFGHLSVKRMQ